MANEKAGSPVPQRGTLFRPEAVEARRTRALGDILLVQPPSFAALSGGFAVIAAVVVGLLVFGSYTQHTTLQGQLVPDRGLLVVQAAQRGTIVARQAEEGEDVERGAVLFEISGERVSALGATEKNVAAEIEHRLESLAAQVVRLDSLERIERESLHGNRLALQAETGHLQTMRAEQLARVELAERAASRYGVLAEQGHVPEEHAALRLEDLHEQRSRLHGLDRELEHAHRQLAETEARLRDLGLRFAQQRAELERAQAATRQERSESAARRRYRVTAPAGGTVTAVLGEPGQSVDAGALLTSIVPRGSQLVARLYAPSRAVGFVEPGDTVRLRHAAFPYQKFGHSPGTVIAVSAAPVTTASPGTEEPLYLVTVTLHAQSVTAYGEPRRLRAGMLVEADLAGERRRLYEWVLEPLYTLGGRLIDDGKGGTR